MFRLVFLALRASVELAPRALGRLKGADGGIATGMALGDPRWPAETWPMPHVGARADKERACPT